MTRQSRTLLILGLMAVGSVIVLGIMAQRYTSVIQQRDTRREQLSASRVSPSRTAPERTVAAPPRTAAHDEAMRAIGAFLQVRAQLKAELDAGESDREALLALRADALKSVALGEAGYLRLRAIYRNWKAGGEGLQEPYRTAMESRRAELEAIDLGGREQLDP